MTNLGGGSARHGRRILWPGVILGLFLISPSASGQVLISTGSNSGLRLWSAKGNDWWLDPGAGRFDLRANGGSNPLLSVLSNGNVGIGTTGPGASLHIQAAAGATTPQLRLARNPTDNNQYLDIYGQIVGTSRIDVVNMINSVFPKFSITQTNNVPTTQTVFQIDNIGNIGIGTTSPNYKLDINGILNATDIYKNGAPFSGTSSQWSGTNPGPISYSGGYVGIGTTNPQYPLQVSVPSAGFIAGFINANGNGGLRFKVNDASDSLGLGAPVEACHLGIL